MTSYHGLYEDQKHEGDFNNDSHSSQLHYGQELSSNILSSPLNTADDNHFYESHKTQKFRIQPAPMSYSMQRDQYQASEITSRSNNQSYGYVDQDPCDNVEFQESFQHTKRKRMNSRALKGYKLSRHLSQCQSYTQDYLDKVDDYVDSNQISHVEPIVHLDLPQKDYKKPSYSYAQLLHYAISTHPDKKMTLSQIYTWCTTNFPYFQKADSNSWTNSIRHNLSINRTFVKIARPNNECGKGAYWALNPEGVLLSTSHSRAGMNLNPNWSTPKTEDDYITAGHTYLHKPAQMFTQFNNRQPQQNYGNYYSTTRFEPIMFPINTAQSGSEMEYVNSTYNGAFNGSSSVSNVTPITNHISNRFYSPYGCENYTIQTVPYDARPILSNPKSNVPRSINMPNNSVLSVQYNHKQEQSLDNNSAKESQDSGEIQPPDTFAQKC